MADLDTGHLFLTYLIPIRRGGPHGDVSYKQKVRIELARLPPAHQTPATQKTKFAAPFARNSRNHFARMFVLDDVVYNGRSAQDALVATVKGVNTIVPGKVDRLRSAYLVFTADIDAIAKEGDPLPSNLGPEEQRKVRLAYAQTLWETMGEEIKAIFGNCHGFDGTDSGAAFGAYLERCHVETTMPYHDYYLSLPAFNTLPLKGLMCIPPQHENPQPFFSLLKKIAQQAGIDNLSMGMSEDYKIGIMGGATHIRVGTYLFGKRN